MSRARRGRRHGRRSSILWSPFVFLLCATGVVSCSANPATGRSQLNFYSEAQEIQMGREADQEIRGSLGLVDDPALQAWVSGIGKRLAAKSERPNLPWTFQVVDDPAVNAFALPGGYIYVTRGILAHLTSEAELASVIGHEIGHVTAQHGVNQMSKAQLATGGLIVGMILAPGAADTIGQLGQTGLGLLFLKNSRADETQADDLGLRYTSKSGFEVREMPKVFDVLRWVGEISGGGRVPNWASSHPDPERRRERSERLIAERKYPAGAVNAEQLLRHTDGLVFGADPRGGYFEENRFFHPDLGFQIDFPAGWTGANEASRVVAMHPDKVAQVQLALAPGKTPEEAAKAFLSQEGLTAGSSQSTRVNGLSAVAADFTIPREGGTPVVGRASFVQLGSTVYQLVGMATEDREKGVRGELSAFVSSFTRLTDRARLEVQAQRVRLVTLPRAMSFAEFAREYPSDAKPELLQLVNGIDDPNQTFAAGALLKRIDGRVVGTQQFGPEAK